MDGYRLFLKNFQKDKKTIKTKQYRNKHNQLMNVNFNDIKMYLLSTKNYSVIIYIILIDFIHTLMRFIPPSSLVFLFLSNPEKAKIYPLGFQQCE